MARAGRTIVPVVLADFSAKREGRLEAGSGLLSELHERLPRSPHLASVTIGTIVRAGLVFLAGTNTAVARRAGDYSEDDLDPT